MAGTVKKVGNHIQVGLDEIRDKPWAEPLGKGLAIGAKIVTGMENFIPGAGILGGAMAFGASLLNPEPSIADLQIELREIKELVNKDTQSKALLRALQKEQKELEERIENPAGEIRSNFDEIKTEMKQIFKSIEEENLALSDDISRMKDVISQTFLLVADVKYRDGIEKVDAAYEVFIAESTTAQFDDFQQYVFELKTIATQNLAPKRIQEYMTIIYKEGGGLSMCQYVMDYIVVVLSKYLQMMVSYYIFREDSARVTSQFEQFNEHFENFSNIFAKVTGTAYRPGCKLICQKPIEKMTHLAKAPEQNARKQLSSDLHTFLMKNDLTDLEDIFQRKSIELDDVLEMDKNEIEEVGIKTYKQRKHLWRAIQDHIAGGEDQLDGIGVAEVHHQKSPIWKDGKSYRRGNNTEAINKSEQWRMKQPRKREFTINGAVLNMAVDETMIGLGTSEAFAVMLQADTGEEVWTMRCEEDEVCSRMEKTDELVQVQISIAKDVVVTVTTSGQVTVWDIRNHEICYREAHHGHIPIYGVCAFGDLIVTGGSDGSLAILTVNKTQQRVQFESLTRNVGQINHLDCDMDYLLMSTAENMKLYSLADRANPKVINTAPTGPVNVCALAYPFAAVTCFEQKGIEVWDMVGCVKIRHLHASIGFRLLHIKDNILAANTRTGQTEDAKIYIHYVGELTNKKIKHEDLWTRRIDCSSEILTPCFGLSSTSLIGITLDGEAGAWSGTSTIAVWDFV